MFAVIVQRINKFVKLIKNKLPCHQIYFYHNVKHRDRNSQSVANFRTVVTDWIDLHFNSLITISYIETGSGIFNQFQINKMNVFLTIVTGLDVTPFEKDGDFIYKVSDSTYVPNFQMIFLNTTIFKPLLCFQTVMNVGPKFNTFKCTPYLGNIPLYGIKKELVVDWGWMYIADEGYLKLFVLTNKGEHSNIFSLYDVQSSVNKLLTKLLNSTVYCSTLGGQFDSNICTEYKTSFPLIRVEDSTVYPLIMPQYTIVFDSIAYNFITCHRARALSFSMYYTPYDIPSWIAICACVTTITVILDLYIKFYLKLKAPSSFLSLLGALIEESPTTNSTVGKALFSRIIAASWLLISTTISSAYIGLIINKFNAPVPATLYLTIPQIACETQPIGKLADALKYRISR